MTVCIFADSRCQVPFQLINYGIWGPSLNTDVNDVKWFLMCTKDHNRFSWLY